jgi:hypothetical protein
MTLQLAHNRPDTRSERSARFVSLGLLCLGGLFLILAVLSTIELLELQLFGVETTGYVIRQEIEQTSVERYEDGTEYTEYVDSHHAIVFFETSQGDFTIRSYHSGTNAPLYPTESQLTVVYPPRNPQKARIQQEISGFHGLFGPFMLVFFGVALVGFSRLLNLMLKQAAF